ncbi:MAG: DNA topoisomerase III [Proteobacteria bacterium]|nr:DNA topoisomerase III [Pseudomonadota bacterium]
MMDLILTEKYSVAADFAKALGVGKKAGGCFEGNNFVITWAVGHLVALCEPDAYDPGLKKWALDTLPLIPEPFQYKPIPQTYGQFKTIKKLLTERHFGRVIIATDAGREGEVIARTILLKCGFTDKSRILRFWTSQALVPEVVRNTMETLRPIGDYDRLWRAGYYRQTADWLIGMNCTRVLTIRLKDLFSVGRVQTAVLALLTDRKQERDLFVPQTYWNLNIVFTGDKGDWTGLWFHDKETRLTQAKTAFSLYQELKNHGLQGMVQSLTREEKKEMPPYLFSLTDLQQEANKKLGFPAKKTLTLAQGLYQDKKCLSYPRTDSRVLGSQNLDLVRAILQKLSPVYPKIFTGVRPGQVSLSNNRVFNDAKLTDHHALIPFKPLPASASTDETKIFDLVIRRFAAAFHQDCRFESTRVVTLFAGQTFQTRGKIILVEGWRQVYPENQPDKETEEIIPPLTRGDAATAKKIHLEEKKTQPPPDYTDSLLLKDMTNPGRYVSQENIKKFFRGDIGIGTQSTRAQIIETLILRNYIVRSGRKLLATDKGSYLVEMLRKCPVSSVLTSPEETARWEMDLNRISLGEDTEKGFLVNIKRFVTAAVAELKETSFELKTFKQERCDPVFLGHCPACGQEVQESRKAYACTGKNCSFVIWKKIAGKHLSFRMAANLLKYRKSGPFNGFISKNKKRFSASLVILRNNGEWQVSLDFEKPEPPAPSESVCPVCGGKIIEGKKGFGCANWHPDDGNCLFVIWKEISGKKLTLNNIATLLEGKATRSYVFKDPKGTKFKAKLHMVHTAPQGDAPKKFVIDMLAKTNIPPEVVTRIPCSR